VARDGEKARPKGREKGVDLAQAADVGRLGPWDEEVQALFEKKGDGLIREGFLKFLL
jgi:hypothetical protein